MMQTVPPDDQLFVAANQFHIRDIVVGSEDMLFSANIFEAAKKKGWWKEENGPLDFTAVYSSPVLFFAQGLASSIDGSTIEEFTGLGG